MCDFSNPNYWDFIQKYYPNYSSCDNILLSDILFRKISGEKISDKDEDYIKDWDLKKEFCELEAKLFREALKNYLH